MMNGFYLSADHIVHVHGMVEYFNCYFTFRRNLRFYLTNKVK